MNNAYHPHDVLPPDAEFLCGDSFRALTGMICGSVVGGAFWLMVVALVLTG